jgi:hypothetical protein
MSYLDYTGRDDMLSGNTNSWIRWPLRLGPRLRDRTSANVSQPRQINLGNATYRW